ncbi:MAG: YCF48-related protein, partial [Ignavibacteria bacterium]
IFNFIYYFIRIFATVKLKKGKFYELNILYIFMKTLFINIIIAAGFLLINRQLYADGLNSVYSRNGIKVIAVGNNGNILISPDFGRNWVSASIGGTNYNSVSGSYISYWIAGDSGVILKSTDDGNSFSQSNVGTNVKLNCVYFINTTTGWVAGNNGFIAETTDGGTSWVQQSTPTTANLNSIKFIFSGNFLGVACGSSGTALVTYNGGSSWISKSIPVLQSFLSADFTGSTIYISAQDGYILKSTNMGNYWSFISFNIKTKPDINCVCASDANNIFTCADGGSIRKSTNGGSSFSYSQLPLFPDLYKMYVYTGVNFQSLWAVSRNTNVVLYSTDGGNAWSLPDGVTQSLSWTQKIPLILYTSSGSVFSLASNKDEIFVTKSNTVYRSLNRGDSWTQIATIPYGSVSNSFIVSPKDTNKFIVAIDSSDNISGKVMLSTNYGQNWDITLSANRSTDGIPLAMDPNHTDTLYYGTTDSLIFRSNDFGATWFPAGPQMFAYNCSMKVIEGHSNVILMGAAEDTSVGSSHLYKSTDFGQSWFIVDSNSGPGYPEQPAIVTSPVNSNIIYASFFLGTQGGLKRSMNQGRSWIFLNIDANAWGLDVARDDPNAICYGDGDDFSNNAPYYSFDGGVHFNPLPLFSSPNFSVLFYNRNTLLMQQWNAFYKLNINFSNPIGVKKIASTVPVKYYLSQNYPNPFNPSTKINFSIPYFSTGTGMDVKLIIYDILGREIATLVNRQLQPGTYEVEWDAGKYSSGIYFYKLEVSAESGAEAVSGAEPQSILFSETKKMILIK